MKKREILATIINIASVIVCTLLAGCKLAIGNLQLTDVSAEIIPPTSNIGE